MRYIIMLLVIAGIAGCTKPVSEKESLGVKKKVYYRIKQVDQDGKESYSTVVYVVETAGN